MRLHTVAIVVPDAGPTEPGAEAGPLALLNGLPVIEHSVAAFEISLRVDEIIVVAPGGPDGPAGRRLAGRYRKLSRVLDAAPARADSVYQALRALGQEECGVLIHDAARPLVGQRVIEDCVTALAAHEAVCAVVPAADTMVVVEHGVVTERPPRDRLRRRQTPQGFRLSVIRRGYELARADPAAPPADDCGIVLRYLPEVTVRLAWGSARNFRVTRPADIGIAETMIRADLP